MITNPDLFDLLPTIQYMKSVPFEVNRSELYSPEELYEGFDPDLPESYDRCFDVRAYRHFMSKGRKSSGSYRTSSLTCRSIRRNMTSNEQRPGARARQKRASAIHLQSPLAVVPHVIHKTLDRVLQIREEPVAGHPLDLPDRVYIEILLSVPLRIPADKPDASRG